MIESTCIQFYSIVMEDERAASQQTMTEMQNAGWQIVTVFPWNMGQIGVLYTRLKPPVISINQESNETGAYSIDFIAPGHLAVPEIPARRTRKPRKQS